MDDSCSCSYRLPRDIPSSGLKDSGPLSKAWRVRSEPMPLAVDAANQRFALTYTRLAVSRVGTLNDSCDLCRSAVGNLMIRNK